MDNLLFLNESNTPISFNKILVKDFNLDATLASGQGFVWDKTGKIWVGTPAEGLICIYQKKNNIYWQTFPQSNKKELINEYLNINFDFQKFKKVVSLDKTLETAYKINPGMRILKQNFYESVISFVISQNNNIPSIRKSIKKLAFIAQTSVKFGRTNYYLFPSIKDIARMSIAELKSCSLGYRTVYVHECAREIETWDLERIKKFSEEKIRKNLMELVGIGPKVADCVLCYSLGFENVTPLDVWGKRILSKYYNVDPNLSYEKMRKWTKNNFFGQAALVGQYLFEYIRTM